MYLRVYKFEKSRLNNKLYSPNFLTEFEYKSNHYENIENMEMFLKRKYDMIENVTHAHGGKFRVKYIYACANFDSNDDMIEHDLIGFDVVSYE